jgi:hypothetical protein
MPFTGDIGHVFTMTVIENGAAKNIAAASSKQFVFFHPRDATLLVVTAAFVTDGSDGKLTYTTISGDLSQEGLWRVQAALTLPTWTGRTSIVDFEVDRVL